MPYSAQKISNVDGTVAKMLTEKFRETTFRHGRYGPWQYVHPGPTLFTMYICIICNKFVKRFSDQYAR